MKVYTLEVNIAVKIDATEEEVIEAVENCLNEKADPSEVLIEVHLKKDKKKEDVEEELVWNYPRLEPPVTMNPYDLAYKTTLSVEKENQHDQTDSTTVSA